MTNITASFATPEIKQLKELVDSHLDQYSIFDSDCPKQLQGAIRHSLLAPGKRLRPLLVLLSAKACNGKTSKAMPAACAVEMIHTYSLIHDDLPAMDDDDFRRGRPTCHKEFGEANAILAGDALIPRAFELLSTEISDAAIALKCCRELSRAAGASMLVGGQVDDLDAENKPGTYEQLRNIHRRKTGALLAVSCKLGGIVAGASENDLCALQNYGENLGLAFQITDDLLDLDGTQTTIGKSPGKDLASGKLTYPSLLGAAESRQCAIDLVDQAIGAISHFESSQDLQNLARFVIHRNV